jgi:hypothetical protein
MFNFNPYQAARAGFGQFTPTNHATLALYNDGGASVRLLVWLAYAALNVINPCGFGLFQGDPGGTPLTPAPMALPSSIAAGVVTQIDTATSYDLDFWVPLGIGVQSQLSFTVPWAVVSPGYAFIMQDQKAGDVFSASIIFQSVAV